VTTLARGVELARREAVVARSLPLCLWRHRSELDPQALEDLPLGPEDKHAFAFLLELAGELGGDRRLLGVAETLRDRRLTQPRSFFRGSAANGVSREFALANKWSFVMNMDLESFRALFDKFVKP
jgi:hypothetical protein